MSRATKATGPYEYARQSRALSLAECSVEYNADNAAISSRAHINDLCTQKRKSSLKPIRYALRKATNRAKALGLVIPHFDIPEDKRKQKMRK